MPSERHVGSNKEGPPIWSGSPLRSVCLALQDVIEQQMLAKNIDRKVVLGVPKH